MSRIRRNLTPSQELIAARDAALAKIEREEDATIRDKWGLFSIEWARRLCAAAEQARASARAVAWDVADRACREARKGLYSPQYFPKWFAPRMNRVVGSPCELFSVSARWIDHLGSSKVKLPTGEMVQCFVAEPYPWFAATWMCRPEPIPPELSAATAWPSCVGGDFALLVPADATTASAVYIARATGCRLIIDRVAYHSAKCIRLLFLPEDHRLRIQDAVDRYKPRPLEEVFSGRNQTGNL